METRIDKINLLEFLEPGQPAAKVLYANIIQDAVYQYLYAFVDKNNISPDQFYCAWRYLFYVTSEAPNTWSSRRNIKQSYTKKNQHLTKIHHLTDDEFINMCFDRHYDYSSLSNHMHIEKFRAGLKLKRLQILKDNWTSVTSNIDGIYNQELKDIKHGRQVPFRLWTNNVQSILVDPPTPYQLAGLLYVPKKIKKKHKFKVRKEQVSNNVGYEQAIANIQSVPDWGPLSTFGD